MKITKAKAEKIAKKIEKRINDGSVDLHKADYDSTIEQVDNKWAKKYPFEVKNVIDFIEFCKESGGFRIF